MTGSRRPPIFGPETWAEIRGTTWCHFDRWFALITVADFDGDPSALRHDLEQRLSSLHGRRDVEAKLSHLLDLQDRLAAAGIDASTISSYEAADRATHAKARRKVLDQSLDGRAMTEAMRVTPRVRLEQRARVGNWPTFPIDPAGWFARLGGAGDRFVSKGGTFAGTQRLGETLADLDRAGLAAGDRLALYRAFHTVALQYADHADDSYGVVGELRLDALRTYVSLDPVAAGMCAEHYWQDLCELIVAEPYGLTYKNETLPFARMHEGDADLVEAILHALSDEWRNAYQSYNADAAQQRVAWLHIAGRRYGRYVETARDLGTRAWMPIVALAQSALAGRDEPLAVEIFRAADQPGDHREYLRRRCRELTGVALDDQPAHLRLVR